MSQVAVITGASAGVGRACVRTFAEHGYDVALLARGREGLVAAAGEVEAAGARAFLLPIDVADSGAVEEAAARIERELGPIDVWVNNAMASVFASFLDVTPEEFERVVSVTFLGQVNGTRAALRRMAVRDRGSIVQVGSALAYRGIPLQSAYCASKHAIQGLCDSLRTELLHQGSNIHVVMVQLPAINTPQFDIQRNKMSRKARPVPPIYQPEVAAKAILFAARSNRREIWVGGPTVRAILGDRVFPGVLDRFLAKRGYASQQRDEPDDPHRADVLFAPMARDLGAHGSFDAQSASRSRQLNLSLSRPVERLRTAIGEPATRMLAAALAGSTDALAAITARREARRSGR
jgi:NAD(P)-dependent dehydrogenase (short-subunit alcohol dehydrogenase family)